jgi:hypothetical protein
MNISLSLNVKLFKDGEEFDDMCLFSIECDLKLFKLCHLSSLSFKFNHKKIDFDFYGMPFNALQKHKMYVNVSNYQNETRKYERIEQKCSQYFNLFI